MGSKCHNFRGQPHLGHWLFTGWLLGGLAPHPHLWPMLSIATSTCLFPGHGQSHHGLPLHCSLNLLQCDVYALCVKASKHLMHWEHRQGRKVLPYLGTALLGCDLCPIPSCTAQGALLCMQPRHPCCSHVPLTCTAPFSSTTWALLPGLQGRLSCSPELTTSEGPFAYHLSGLISRAIPLSRALPWLVSLPHMHRSKAQRYRGPYQHILTKVTTAFLL